MNQNNNDGHFYYVVALFLPYDRRNFGSASVRCMIPANDTMFERELCAKAYFGNITEQHLPA